MTTRRSMIRSLAGGAVTLGLGSVIAQEDRSPVTVLVGAASTMDASARMLSEHLREVLGRPVLTVSKLGAGGRLALADLRRALPNGRTLMLSTSSPFAIYPNIYTKLDYDPVADFTPIAGLAWFDVALATGPGTGTSDLKSLVAWSKAKGAEALYGAAPGAGSSSHFAGIALALATGVPLTVVPYKSSADGIADVVTGRVPMLITGTGAMTEMHKAGRLRLLATTGTERTPLVGDVPTFLEAGIDVKIVNSVGLFGPPNLPPDIVSRLAAAVDSMLAKADARAKLLAMGMTPAPMSAPQLAASLAEDRKHFELLVRKSGYVPEVG